MLRRLGKAPVSALSVSPVWYFIVQVLVALGSAMLLWFFRNGQQVGDSLGIAYYIRSGVDMSNPHHLLYGPIVWVFHRFANIYIDIDVIAIGQLHNIVWALIAVFSLIYLVRHYTASSAFALLSGLVLLVSHQFWQYSTQLEVYIPALGCLALGISLLVRAGSAPLTLSTTIVTIVLMFLSICYHQMGVLFFLPLAGLFYLQWGKVGIRSWFAIILVTGMLTLLAYVVVYLIMYYDEASVMGFVKYCLLYAYSNPDWGTFEHFTKYSELVRIFQNINIAFLAPYWAAKVPVWVTALGFLGICLGNVVVVFRKGQACQLRVLLLGWVAIYFAFLLWWTPGYEFFTMLMWPILLLALFTLFDVAQLLKQNWLPMIAACIMFIGLLWINASTFAHYHHHHDEGYYKAEEVMAYTEPGCVVITNFNIMLNLMYYHHYTDLLESDGLMIEYYHKDSVSEKMKFAGANCVIIEMWYYNPWYAPLGENGFDKPNEWLQMNGNLFNFQRDSLGQLAAMAPFEVVAAEGMIPYLRVDRTTSEAISGYQSFFNKMDSLVAINGQEKDVSYLNWYEQNKHLMQPSR